MQRVVTLIALLAMAVCASVACQRPDLPEPAAARSAPPPCHPAPAPAPDEAAPPCLTACVVTQAEAKIVPAPASPLVPVALLAPQTLPAGHPAPVKTESAPEERYLRLRVLRI
jgi:hypothetical protein